jgi:hypothetical protein
MEIIVAFLKWGLWVKLRLLVLFLVIFIDGSRFFKFGSCWFIKIEADPSLVQAGSYKLKLISTFYEFIQVGRDCFIEIDAWFMQANNFQCWFMLVHWNKTTTDLGLMLFSAGHNISTFNNSKNIPTNFPNVSTTQKKNPRIYPQLPSITAQI